MKNISLMENTHDIYGDRSGVSLVSANRSWALALGLDYQKDMGMTLAEALLLVYLE